MSEATVFSQAVERSEKQNKDWTPARIIYTGLMVFNLLSFVWLLVTGSGIEMPLVIWITRIAVAPLAIYLGKLWKDKGFLFLTAYFLLFFFRVFIPQPGNIFHGEMSESILSAVWLFAGCYGMARILSIKQMKSLFRITAYVWFFSVTILCILGIYAVWNEHTFSLLNEKTLLGFEENRLKIVYAPTVTGALLSFTVLIGLICAVDVKNKWGKAAFAIGGIPIVIALGLTDTRTAFISFAAGAGVLASIAYFHFVQKTQSGIENKNRIWKPYVISFFLMIVTFVIALWVIMQIPGIYNHVKVKGIIPRAYAEETGTVAVSNRGLDTSNMLSGRAVVWREIKYHFRDYPFHLLTGESKISPLSWFQAEWLTEPFAHCHSIYYQVLVESGIPGLLLLFSFCLCCLICTVRAIHRKDIPLWIKLLPAIMISLLVGDLAESFLWLRSSQCPMNAAFFIAAGIVCSCGRNRKQLS